MEGKEKKRRTEASTLQEKPHQEPELLKRHLHVRYPILLFVSLGVVHVRYTPVLRTLVPGQGAGRHRRETISGELKGD